MESHSDKLLTAEQVRQELNLDNIETVYRYIKLQKDPLPCLYLTSKNIRIKKSALLEWLDKKSTAQLDKNK